MTNTPQQQDKDDKKNPIRDQGAGKGMNSGQGMKQTPQSKPDDKRTNPADDKHGQTDRRDAQR